MSKEFYNAVEENNLELVSALLENKDVNVNARDGNGLTALSTASCRGHAKMVELLIKNKADVNSKDNFQGRTALIVASFMRDIEIAKLLIDNGADANIADDNRLTPLCALYNTNLTEVELPKLLIGVMLLKNPEEKKPACI